MPYWGIYLLLNIPIGLFLLIKGRQFAWQNKSWASPERFNVVQRRWTVGGFVFFVLLTSGVVHQYQRDQQSMQSELDGRKWIGNRGNAVRLFPRLT